MFALSLKENVSLKPLIATFIAVREMSNTRENNTEKKKRRLGAILDGEL